MRTEPPLPAAACIVHGDAVKARYAGPEEYVMGEALRAFRAVLAMRPLAPDDLIDVRVEVRPRDN